MPNKEVLLPIRKNNVFGFIESNHDLFVNADLRGDIFCEAVVHCSGTIHGNIIGNKIVLEKAWVQGSVICREIVTDTLSNVQGNIFAYVGEVNCYIKGTVVFRSDDEILQLIASKGKGLMSI